MGQVDELINQVATSLYGMTPDEARKKSICIKCKKFPRLLTNAERAEYNITGLCGPCFKEETEEEMLE